MERLQTEQFTFKSMDGGSITDENQRNKMLQNFMAPSVLTLRIDAQVMLIKNVDDTLVNGSMGRVVRFVDPAVYGTELDVDGEGGMGVIGAAGVTGIVGSAAKKSTGSTAGMTKLYPVVEFIIPHGGKRKFLVMPEVWKVELPNGEVQVSRSQVGLNWCLNHLISDDGWFA
jgi:ATP-dependent DNA helicase PIF1